MASTVTPVSPSFLECTTGLILAGGEGRRMGGLDKGLLPLHGQPLVSHVAARLAPQVSTLLISANRNCAAYAELGWPVLADAPDHARLGHCGPLAGLYAGLCAARTDYVLCAPCDVPRLPMDSAQRLWAALETAPLALAECAGRLQPTVCLVPRSLAPILSAHLATGGRRMGEWLLAQGARAVPFTDVHAFANANTAAALAALEDCYTQTHE